MSNHLKSFVRLALLSLNPLLIFLLTLVFEFDSSLNHALLRC